MSKSLALLLIVGSVSLNGCAALGLAAAGAGAGYVAHDEATENDGNFDPLEDVADDVEDAVDDDGDGN